MKIEITGKHIEITLPIRTHVEAHCQKLEQYFKDKIPALIHVIVSVEKNRQQAEIIVNWMEHTLTASETHKDLYQAVTRASDKLEKQVRRLKDKVVDRKHSAPKIAAAVSSMPGAEILEAAPLSPQIIVSNINHLKPMTADEAILALEDEDNQFIVFRETDSESFCVLYKRADGNFGLIQL